MNKIILTCLLCLSLLSVRGQYVSIPDTTFGNWLNQNGFASCMTGSSLLGWQINTNSTIVNNTFSMTLPDSNLIHTIDGVQYFNRLVYLSCGNYSHIDSIRALPPSLVVLMCTKDTFLYSLPMLPSSLSTLYCWENRLRTLPTLPNSLISLDCDGNLLDSLPTLPNTLTELFCVGNRLTNLPSLPDSLHNLGCNNNFLTTLPNLPHTLSTLTCRYNQITSLPALPDSLQYFDCSYNPNLVCLPYLNIVVNLNYLGTAITCLPDTPKDNGSVSPHSLTVCSTPCSPTAINSMTSVNETFMIYPNPTTGKIHCSFNLTGHSITISDFTGRNLPISTTENEIDISTFPSGVYCLRLQDNTNSKVINFVKE
jgi:hypothetical protein